MKPLSKEWVNKAEGDYTTAQRELRARKSPNYDAACYHSQQCAEKYLKALLQENDIAFGKTHNLMALLEKLIRVYPLLEGLNSAAVALNVFAIDFRYPGESANRELAVKAVALCREIRRRARDILHLKT
jgi:HEPN domain-containing protein